MKNFILSAAIIAIAGVSTVKANEIKNPVAITIQNDSSALSLDSTAHTTRPDSVANTVKQDDPTKVPVKLEALPDPVKATLKADAYKEWTPTTAFLVTNADKSTFYQVDVKNGDKVAFLKIGADGVVQQ